ncbi:hypothetical protein [Chryseobacterium sp.]|uniref:hypothetical protein n=1 Tax=Chryseobacterium sp. TaxID=1871047 RepID=UPI0011CC6904|nr:hypothetical protein [Chryseobacterium sp.]TXF79320.1 hypothetical protein FUA25_02730 [Chryseobacterium sp.]
MKFDDYVQYAFVKYKTINLNDTVYFDGRSKWWIIKEGNVEQYHDEKEKMKFKLQYFYPIFRDCMPISDPNLSK